MKIPNKIRLNTAEQQLELGYANGEQFTLPAEFLRVLSPSAEVQGHGPSQKVLVGGKQNVNIRAIETVGQYAVVLRFDDGHETGIYSWKLLYEMGRNQIDLWDNYVAALTKAGMSRA